MADNPYLPKPPNSGNPYLAAPDPRERLPSAEDDGLLRLGGRGNDTGYFVIKGGPPYSRVAVPPPPDDIALRQWAFERAQQIIGTTALTEDVIESADAILAWVTKRGAAHG